MVAYEGSILTEPGDSGAPLYVYSDSSSFVYLRGMHVAIAGGTMFAEPIGKILALGGKPINYAGFPAPKG